jgi:hypothetical protein
MATRVIERTFDRAEVGQRGAVVAVARSVGARPPIAYGRVSPFIARMQSAMSLK